MYDDLQVQAVAADKANPKTFKDRVPANFEYGSIDVKLRMGFKTRGSTKIYQRQASYGREMLGVTEEEAIEMSSYIGFLLEDPDAVNALGESGRGLGRVKR